MLLENSGEISIDRKLLQTTEARAGIEVLICCGDASEAVWPGGKAIGW